MYELISDRIRKVADFIDIDEEKPKPKEIPDFNNELPSAPKIKPKRRINPDNKVMAPGTVEGKKERKDYQSEYRADGKDINSRYVKKLKSL